MAAPTGPVPAGSDSVPDRVRAACAWVAEQATTVRVDPGAIEDYASGLEERPGIDDAPDPRTELSGGDRETRAAFAVCLDAINFGSGWWPTIIKRPGLSGYGTIAAGVVARFEERGAWTAAELTGLDGWAVADLVGQDPEHPLVPQFAAALRDVGAHVEAEHGGSFARLADAAAGSATALVDRLATWDAFADVSPYREHPIPFFKRAQIAAADLDRIGVASFADLDRLTAFADNLVPHVLRVDGVLRLHPRLEQKIEAGELLEHGSQEEVELRACAVAAIEQLAAATDGRLIPARIDALLWNRGRDIRYKAIPRPRSRSTAY